MSNETRTIAVRVTEEFRQQLKDIALANRRTVSREAQHVLEQYVARSTPPAPETPRS
jgi:predicted transcriptional regulator